jgi:hypothetical protein
MGVRTRSQKATRRGGAGRVVRVAALTAALPFAGACYSFSPVALDPVPVGENVRLVVTRAGVPDLLSVAERVDLVPVIRGRVTGSEGGSLLVRMPLRQEQGQGLAGPDVAQLVRVPIDEILAVELQSFSLAKTSFFIAGAAGAAAFVVFKIIDGGRGDDGTDPPDPDVFFSLFRIPVG